MVAEHLKNGKPEAKQVVDGAKTEVVPEGNPEAIETRGDAAARNMLRNKGRFAPPSFRLTASEIEAAVDRVFATVLSPDGI